MMSSISAGIDQFWRELDQFPANSAKFGTRSANSEKMLGRVRPCLGVFGQVRANSTKFGARSAKFGRFLGRVRPIWSEFGQFQVTSANIRRILTNFGASSARCSTNFGHFRATVFDHQNYSSKDIPMLVELPPEVTIPAEVGQACCETG